jgi:hypothetical protein
LAPAVFRQRGFRGDVAAITPAFGQCPRLPFEEKLIVGANERMNRPVIWSWLV